MPSESGKEQRRMTMKKSITNFTAEQEKQYRRFVEDASNRALKEVNPDKDGLQRLIEKGGEFQAYIVAGIARFTAKAPNYELARTILGKDFISPEEIATARGVTYTDEQIAKFGDTLPVQEMLEWCRNNDMMLVAGPPKAMSLIDMRPNKDSWYTREKENFSRNDKVESTWIALRKEPVVNSFSKNWNEQQRLITEPTVVPNIAEAVWGFETYKAARGKYLLSNCYVRTSSIDSDGFLVLVGDFDAGGLHVSYDWDSYRIDYLGVASARKF
jgi:hypothetical protein